MTGDDIWVIPIVDGRTNEVTGSVILSDEDVVISGNLFFPEQPVIREEPNAPVYTIPRSTISRSDAPPARPEPKKQQNLELLETLQQLFDSDPRLQSPPLTLQVDMEEARARGRKVYEQAVKLSEERCIPLAQALAQVGNNALKGEREGNDADE